MIETSFKRLNKIKKKLHPNSPSHYHFLINSLQRDSNKQNHSSNHLHNKTSLKNSIELKTNLIMINSFDNNNKHLPHNTHFSNTQILNNTQILHNTRQSTKINLRNTHSAIQNPPFFQNIKFLKNSRIHEDPQPNLIQWKCSDPSKTYKKNIELSQNIHSKVFQQIKEPKSNKFTEDLADSLEQKVQNYVEFVNQFLQEMVQKYGFEKGSTFSRKKNLLELSGDQLLRELKKGPEIKTMKNLSKSIEVSNFSSFPSKVISRELERSINLKQVGEENCLQRKLMELYKENNMLSNLVSEHESQNIKMFVRMNCNESDEIERCKKILKNLFDKYESLKKLIVKENEKSKKIEEEKKKIEGKIAKIQVENNKLNEQVERLKGLVEEMNSQTLSKVSFEEESQDNTVFNFTMVENKSKNQKKKKGNQSFIQQQSQMLNSKVDKSFATKRDKAASCLSKHQNEENAKSKDEEMMSCSSTITKTKNMKKKKGHAYQKGVSVNLKEQFEQIGNEEISNLKREMGLLKSKLNDEMTRRLGVEKEMSELEMCLRKGKEKLQKREKIINEQLQEIEKLMEANKRLETEVKLLRVNSAGGNTGKIAGGNTGNNAEGKAENTVGRGKSGQIKEEGKGVHEVLEQIKKLNQIKVGTGSKQTKTANLSQKGINFTSKSQNLPFNDSEYRIIAMQAKLIESLLGSSH